MNSLGGLNDAMVYIEEHLMEEINKEQTEILWHENPDTSKDDYQSEIWIPVHKTSAKL